MRVVLARAGALGDVMLLRSALWRLRAHGHAVTLLAPERSASLLVGRAACQADELLDYDGAEAAAFFAGRTPRAWQERLACCDRAIAYTRSSDFVSLLGRSVSVVDAHDPRPPAGIHAAAWLCEPVRRLGVPSAPALPVLPVSARSASGLVAVHPGSGSSHKNWPAARFIEVAQRLSAGRRWLWITGPAENALREPPPGAEALVCPTLAQLAAALSAARLYLGNDSGVTHLAAAVGTPTLALFGPTPATMWAPVGPRVHALQAPDGNLQQLSVEAVYHAASDLRL